MSMVSCRDRVVWRISCRFFADLNRIVRYLKKMNKTNGTVVDHPEYGEVLQLNGDQRQAIKDFLVRVGIVTEDRCKVHGF